MQPYGKKKRGSGKIHPHNECGVCSENSFNKKKAREEGEALAKEGFNEWLAMLPNDDFSEDFKNAEKVGDSDDKETI
jgi:hypothetical protein